MGNSAIGSQQHNSVSQDLTAHCSDPWHDRDSRGRLPDEVPYRMGLGLGDDGRAIVEQLGLRPTSLRTCAALDSLIANAWYAAVRGATWVFYSRDRQHYADAHRAVRLCPDFYTRKTMIAGVEMLEQAGLMEHWKTSPSPYAEHRSRFRATPSLLAALGPARVANLITERGGPPVVLKDDLGRMQPVPNTRDIGRMQRDFNAHNEFLAQFQVEVVHPDVSYDHHGFLYFGSQWFNKYRRRYYRVFNRDFSHGGRWYGPFWQGLPKAAREALQIDGRPTVEVDFRACHLPLLSAKLGQQLPFDDPSYDPYAVPGIERAVVKLAFNVMLNADSREGALGALANKFRDTGRDPAYPLARTAMGGVIAHFPGFESCWNTGIGLRLQNLDARICARVQRALRSHGVPVLSVHDSFIVPAEFKTMLQNTMEREMSVMCTWLILNTHKYRQ